MMQENKENPNELLELLLEKCDRLYQENILLKGKLEDRTDVDALKTSYEQTISKKDEKILDLEKQVAYLRRRIWGKSSERFIKEDPRQRMIDFEGIDFLPEEKELAEAAKADIETFKERRVKERVKRKPKSRSYAGASLLAELMINKYVNHLPFYRQIQMMKQVGVNLPPPTVNDWFKDTADLLRPLYYRLKELVLDTDYIQVDETTVPVINNEKHKSVNGYMWMVRSAMNKQVFFHYDNGSRAQKVALSLLKDFRGAMQTDGYSVYQMYEYKKDVLPLGCWAHARRKFEESLKNDRERAGYALEQIGLLYEVEREADDKNLSYQERAKLRETHAYPIMVVFEKWLVNEYGKVLPKSPIGKAIKYCYDIYHRLSRYHLDGRYHIDNNLAENSLRGIALGRKNYLFCGNHDAAEDAAVIYSLLGCCKAADVNFRDWMVYVLSHIHDYDEDYTMDLAELLPLNHLRKIS